MNSELEILKAELESYKTLFNETDLPMIIIDEKGKYLDYNHAYMKLFGYKDKSELKLYDPSYVSADTQPNGECSQKKSIRMIELALQKGEYEFQWMHKKANNDTFLSHVVLTKIKFKNKTALRAEIKDISEQMRFQRLLEEKTKEIEEQKRILRNVIDENPNPIILKNYEGKFTLVNKAVAELYNTTVDDMIGKDDGDYIEDKSLVNFFRNNVKQIMNEGKTKIIYEDSIDVKTGKKRNFISIKKPFINVNGEPNILILANDITELKEKSNKLKEQEHMLFQQSKMAAMGEMLENIAHQWRQPLSVISTSSTHIKLCRELNQMSLQEELEYLENINHTVNHLSDTIDDFREFFKPDKEVSLITFDDLLKKINPIVSMQLNKSSIYFIKNIQDIKMYTLKNELIQVLMNIFNNARDALAGKDIEKRILLLEIYTQNNDVHIDIQDNAGGIKEEIINNIFDAYFTTKSKTNGTGIGLYMSKEIITKHLKGSIDVSNDEFYFEDEKYLGAKFKITLPLNE